MTLNNFHYGSIFSIYYITLTAQYSPFITYFYIVFELTVHQRQFAQRYLDLYKTRQKWTALVNCCQLMEAKVDASVIIYNEVVGVALIPRAQTDITRLWHCRGAGCKIHFANSLRTNNETRHQIPIIV